MKQKQFVSLPFVMAVASPPHVSPWQLDISDPGTGYVQMMLDAERFYTLDRRDASTDASTAGIEVRFYQWRDVGISLGFSQEEGKRGVPVLDRFREEGWEVVRRPTGGGLILHTPADFVYSVIAPRESELYPDTLMGAYHFFSQGIYEGLKALGLHPALPTAYPPAQPSPNGAEACCFAHAKPYEALLGGKKVFGSAQRRGRNVLLQQGIVVTQPFDLTLVPWLTAHFPELARTVTTSGTLADILPTVPEFLELSNHFQRGFQAILGFQWRGAT